MIPRCTAMHGIIIDQETYLAFFLIFILSGIFVSIIGNFVSISGIFCGIFFSDVFRWFKFTLKPPYTITHGNLLMAIWDTSHWTSFANLDSRQLKTSPMTSYDQFWNMSTFGDSRAIQVICQKKMPSENRFFSQWRSDKASMRLGDFRWAGP